MKRLAPALLVGLAAIIIGEVVLESQAITTRPMQPLSAQVLKVCDEGGDEERFPILRDIGSGFGGGASENDLSIFGAKGLKFLAGAESSIVGTKEEIEDAAANLEIHNDRSDAVRVEVRGCSPERPVMGFELPGGSYYSTILQPGAYSLGVRSLRDGWTIRVVLRSKQDGHEYHVRYHQPGRRIPSSNVSRSGNAGAE